MDLPLVTRLASPEGRALLAVLPPYDEGQAIPLAHRLRRQGHDPDLVAAALTQSRLRQRAAATFGERAAQLLFTVDGLEQATRPQVSARHTRRFVEAGLTGVVDLGCGIGADALVSADAGLGVRAAEADPVTAEIARANLAAHPAAEVLTARAEDVRLPDDRATGAWLDPARRIPGRTDARGRTRRTFRLGEVSPSWGFVQDVAARATATGAKFGPGFPHDRIPADAEAQWVSFGGAALECSLWWGAVAVAPGVRSVAVHDGTGWHTLPQDPAGPGPGGSGAGPRSVEPGCAVLDPDRALLAAGLLPELCTLVGGQESAPGSGYVVLPDVVRTPFARCLRVREVLPLQTRALRSWARAHDVGPLTIKKRGPDVHPEALRAQVRPRGSQEATLLVTRVGRSGSSPLLALWVTDPSRA